MTHPSPVNTTYADGVNTIHGADINAYGVAINQLATLTNPLPVSAGGTGIVTATGLLVGSGTSNFTTIGAPASAVVGVSDTQTLTNKTVFASTAQVTTTGGTTTLTISSASIEIFTGTQAQTVLLPTTGVPLGAQFWIVNTSTGAITVNASGGTTVTTVASGALTIVTALAATPTVNTQWGFLAGLTASFSTSPTASALAEWDTNKNLSANNWLPLQQSTVTAGTTTTLTVASSQVQIFTGSTTQTVLLPTTSVNAGYQYIIENQSSGAVTVQSSGANTITVLPASSQGVFIATLNTPTTAAGWDARVSIAGKSLTAANSLTLAGTDGTTVTFPANPTNPAAAASTIAGWDANFNLTANNVQCSYLQVTSAAGNTALTIGSSGIIEVTGTTTQTITLPTTSVPAGLDFMIINQSTGIVTVNASGGGTIITLSGYAAGIAPVATVTALIATPTTAANWNCQHNALDVATGQILHVSNGMTLAVANGVNTTTQTFPLTPTTQVDGEQFCTLTTAYTLTSQTAAQKLFNSSATGAVTLPIGTYFFECLYSLSALNTGTSSVFGFALVAGTATIAFQLWEAEASSATLTTPTAPLTTVNTAANVALVSANTTGIGWAKITGKCRISVAGTVIPSVSLNTAAAAVVGVDSYFRCWNVGLNTVQTFGTWT